MLVTPLNSSIHYGLWYISTGMISLSFAITGLCVFIIVRMSSKTSTHYARLLILVTIIPLSCDVSYHFLLNPAPLLPLFCLYRWRPLIPIPGSVTIYYTLWVLTIAWNACAYAACFMHRHQIVVPPGSIGKFSRRLKLGFFGVICTFSLLPVPILKLAELSDVDTHSLLNQTSGFTNSELDRITCYDTGWSYAFIGYSYTAFLISIFFLILLTSHIFILLRDSYRSMSDKTRSFHRTMTRALVTQAAVSFIFLLAPLIVCYIVYTVGIDMSILYFLAFISTHSFVHSATVLGTTPLYRRALKDLFTKGSGKPFSVGARELSIVSLHGNTRAMVTRAKTQR